MRATNSNFYQVGASLPVDAPSYVKREADEVFYQKLQAGKFCYVLNSRQMGKSSLRVQTMQRLQKEGTVCAAIDLTGIGKVNQEQWYGGIVYNLSESCQLEDKFDFDWQEWWGKNQTILSPVQCLGLFIEKVLLDKIQQPIVIFVDEIDKVLSQDFSTDDFFGLIRFFQNQRVDNPIFERLTFALLGVATPGDLIQNKTQTPFNIGEAIELDGFQINEVKPLIKGLEGKCDRPQVVMAEILNWTGGQPFLTQKLCKFMVEESTALRKSKIDEDDSILVREVVESGIIENWESQDDPEHLRTIRDRILSSEQRAGYLLELYQQIQKKGQVTAKKNLESSELRLSGLVIQKEGKLKVYNRVYQRVFNQHWVEIQLKNLRPYSEAFRFWIASGGKDKSRLLRGLALESAEEWAKDKNLSFQDKQFLAASREKEIQEKIAVEQKEAQLERERKDKEAAEKRNLVLSEANRKAKRRIRSGSFVLILALLGTFGLGVFAAIEANKALEAQKMFKEANTKTEKADKKFQDANAKADVAEKKIMGLQQQTQQLQKNANVAKQKAQRATAQAQVEQQKAQKAQKIANDANQKAIEANQKFENANTKAERERKKVIGLQQQAQQLQKNANVAKQQAQRATAQAKAEQQKAQKAQESARLASQQAQTAKQEAEKLQNQLASVKKDVETVQALSKLAGELRNENLTEDSDKALRQAGLSFRVEDHNLKQAMLLTSISQAYEKLKKPGEAEKKINESLEYLRIKGNKISSDEGLQIQVFVKANQGNFLAEKSPQQAIKAYQKAYNILKKYPTKTNPFGKDKILTANDIELVHRRLLKLLPNHNHSNFKKQVWSSLKEHFYAELGSLLNRQKPNWEAADVKTTILMLFIANRDEEREEERYLDIPHIERFSCTDLKRVDKLWVDNSKRYFGLSVQKEIWVKTGNRLSIKISESNYSDDQNFFDGFGVAVGWLEDYKDYRRGTWVSYSDMLRSINNNPFSQDWRGGLPTITRTGLSVAGTEWIVPYLRRLQAFFSRAATCGL